MAVTDYAKKYSGAVDEKFKAEAKSEGAINKDFDFVGAKTVVVYNVSTSKMNDYKRTGNSRYGEVEDLNVGSQEMTMTKDRSFSFAIDKMDEDETGGALNAGKALARQIKEVIIPEVDAYRFNNILSGAGNEKVVASLTKTNIYDEITAGTEAQEEAEVPLVGRYLYVTPATYKLMKQSTDIILDTEIGQEMRVKGIVAMVDDMPVVRVPANRLGANVHFIITHSMAATSPVKLAEYKTHTDVPGISGELCEGRVYYDCFVLENKADAIYACVKTATVKEVKKVDVEDQE
ncbi:MAG: hypothetical protein RR406_03115 [Bacilli bacterium]